MSLVDSLLHAFTELKNSDISPDCLGDLEIGYIQTFVHDNTGFNIEDTVIKTLWVSYNNSLQQTFEARAVKGGSVSERLHTAAL